ncbi:coenzyme F420-0:L-glutamate ligase [Ornithinimicrobium cerasi]|uniref:coenzyme F420-0:L-glutamate ligase n=1 Tax=Ornithinimicrobium cerasi TaxID=2248773 RepID=UPI001FD250B7|nr:coenzyme F420-0:L-glutamate ligase [Ornithinimicrobium cerasi]
MDGSHPGGLSSATPPGTVVVLPLHGLPEVREGADLAGLLVDAAGQVGGLRDGDVLVVSSKVVSKARGLREPAGEGREALVLRHARRVVAERRTTTGTTRIVEAEAGPVMAAAGLDASNTGPDGGVLVLPADPDRAAAVLRAEVVALVPGIQRLGLVLSDTAGRPWRAGQTDLALGAAGVGVLDDLRSAVDADGRPLAVTARAVADEIAAAADLVKGKVAQVPAALLRGLDDVVPSADAGASPGARSLVRTGPGDWFALGHREAVRAALGAPPATAAAAAVGVPAAGPEEEPERGARAVRLALLGHEEARVHGSPASGYAVHAQDPVLAGRVAARLEVALVGEEITATVQVIPTPGG